ncbi:MAG: hypothetical protein NT166_30230 [Candidatus Aminicenantes bacterium]|nr:hypothetical protein [Candidatus Aminicenantes bacterium]
MKDVTFEIKSLLKFQLDMVEFPELSSPKHWVQKGINILNNYAPKVLRYLSRQHILAELIEYRIVLKTAWVIDDDHIKNTFSIWIRKEMLKRLVFVVSEGLILPFTPFLALLPGPNIFFYVPALLFYYHLRSYLGLRKIHVHELNIEVVHIIPPQEIPAETG